MVAASATSSEKSSADLEPATRNKTSNRPEDAAINRRGIFSPLTTFRRVTVNRLALIVTWVQRVHSLIFNWTALRRAGSCPSSRRTGSLSLPLGDKDEFLHCHWKIA